MEEDRPTGEAGTTSGMTQEQLAIWRSLLDVTDSLGRALSAELLEESGLSSSDYQVLLALIDSPEGRMRSSLLAQQMGWERSRLSHQLRRMQARNLVTREGDPADSRATIVSLTSDGRVRFTSASRTHTGTVKRYFVDALTPDQLTALGEVMDALQKHLDDL
jgi:DNA-binding MarR family transcriptional regulator